LTRPNAVHRISDCLILRELDEPCSLAAVGVASLVEGAQLVAHADDHLPLALGRRDREPSRALAPVLAMAGRSGHEGWCAFISPQPTPKAAKSVATISTRPPSSVTSNRPSPSPASPSASRPTPFVISFATHLSLDGYDAITIQKLMGHKDIRTTMKYVHAAVKLRGGVRSPADVLLTSLRNPSDPEVE